ncbi:hypothetical protein ILUMI_01062 [Ignelater luminosus]|uniref:Chromo domain-containing protein n=1 Tax=Ignelater luminosus TaxID=2038154 RepID=A0A8K0GPL0_IGNLU|nr:hypothetical protein ILUMI_01062 [Ignelater luminosus]
MDYAKKMVLVAPEVVQRLSTAETTEPKTLSHLDSDMQKVLKSKLEDREKWTEYYQALQRYLHFTAKTRQPISISIEVDSSGQCPQLSQEAVIATVPPTTTDTRNKHGRIKTAKTFKSSWLSTPSLEEPYDADLAALETPAKKKRSQRRSLDWERLLWQADLCDMKNLSKYNDGVNYILTVIDVFSKKVWVRPLKNKTFAEVINAFKKVFQQNGTTPENLQSDKEKEFVAQFVQNFLCNQQPRGESGGNTTILLTQILIDLNDESVEGTFYQQELQPVSVDSDTLFKIEVLDEKGGGQNKKYLVKWLGYNDKFNSWVSAADIKQI